MFKRSVVQPDDKTLATCTSCGVTKSRSEFYACKPGSVNDRTYGFAMPCKECNRARCRGYKRGDELLARDAERKRLPEVMEQARLQKRAVYATEEGRTRILKNGAKQYAKNGDAIRAKMRADYHAPGSLRKRQVLESSKRRRATPEGRAAHNASNAARKKTERGRLLSRMHRQLRRARMKTTVCDLTDEQWLAMVAAYEGCCAYCGVPGDMTIDHIEAIANGGAHTLTNVAPACRACNLKKNAKTFDKALLKLGVSRVDFLKRRTLALFRLRCGLVAA